MNPFFKITSRCISCDNCRLVCPKNCIIAHHGKYTIETWACNLCHLCQEVCPADSIKLIHPNGDESAGISTRKE